MDLVVRAGKGHSMNSEAYTLMRIIVDPEDGIIFECQDKKTCRKVTVKPPRFVREGISP